MSSPKIRLEINPDPPPGSPAIWYAASAQVAGGEPYFEATGQSPLDAMALLAQLILTYIETSA